MASQSKVISRFSTRMVRVRHGSPSLLSVHVWQLHRLLPLTQFKSLWSKT